MNPDQALRELRTAYMLRDWERVRAIASPLLSWLNGGGSAPNLHNEPLMDDMWNWCITRYIYRFALSQAEVYCSSPDRVDRTPL